MLLLSDAGINVDKGGFSQTLYNIFSFLKPVDILIITSQQAYNTAPSSPPFNNCTLTYNIEMLPVQKNRLATYANGFINWFNYGVNQIRSFGKLRSAIKKFNPDIVVCAPNGPEALFMYYRLRPVFEQKKVFPYFMDDWLYQSRFKWPGGNIHNLAKKLLSEHPQWMMISESLANIFAERYHVSPSGVLEIHNPVDVSNFNAPAVISEKDSYTIAYAGALWPMHFDAFVVIAEAVNLLKKKRNINFVLYTTESQWQWRKAEVQKLGVVYGGHVPYSNIHNKLKEADCLLVTSSFSKEWETHSKGSVQTKLTDYMKAGRLIIGCGPAYAANHSFLKKHDCGICIETNNASIAANKLDGILDNIEANQHYVQQGWQVLKTEFSFEKVHQRLRKFLST